MEQSVAATLSNPWYTKYLGEIITGICLVIAAWIGRGQYKKWRDDR